MEPYDLRPQEPQQQKQTIAPQTLETINENKKFPKKLVMIGMAAIVIVVTGVLVLSATTFMQSSRITNSNNPSQAENISANPKAVEQVFVSPVDGKKTDIKEVQYYSVAVGTTVYYGRVSKINNDYIRMSPTAYKKGDILTFTGNELHGPETTTYFHVSKITKFQDLTDRTITDALKTVDKTVTDAFPSNNIDQYVKGGQFQAYYFTDGTAFFAKTVGLDGNFLANSSHVYILRTNSSSRNINDISLVLAKPEQYNTRTSADLTHWQNMKNDGQITKAATQFEQTQLEAE